MIAIGVGLILVLYAVLSPTSPDWLSRGLLWLGGMGVLAAGYVVVELRRK